MSGYFISIVNSSFSFIILVCPFGKLTLTSSTINFTSTVVSPSSAHVTFISISSLIDLARICKKRYSISNNAKSATFTLVCKQSCIVFVIASNICCWSSFSNANINNFCSLTRNGLYFTFFFVEGTVNV